MARSPHTLTVPASTASLETVRRFVEARATAACLPQNTAEQMKLAVDEACTNVVKHAYAGQRGETFNVDVIVEPERFTVCIRDTGIAFDPGTYQQPDLQQAVRTRRRGGLGVHLMRRLVDQVEYRSRGNINEVYLVKYLGRDSREEGCL